ncbi:DNA-directed RNA polymerase subunit omega [Acidobacteria bacterium AB60]|nr:DNA-directed RNA polymerase subunit omega [Acidobacteria bacterium AB60]
MRSELVYQAGLRIENRFLLATTTMRATRRLHVSATRTEDTVNKVLEEVAKGTPLHGELPEVAPPPTIDVLVTAPVG